MSKLLEIGGVAIHADSDGRFSLNDLHKAAGGEDRHEPHQFTRLDQTQALIAEINSADSRNSIQTKRGASGGTYACRELIIAYAAWISPAFHLKVIRTFDAAAMGGSKPISKSAEVLDATKLFRPLFQIARIIGCDKQAAAISANQAVQAVSGIDTLALLGQTHIEAANQDALFFTPTQLGEKINVSARKFNLLLAEAGFQFKRGDEWEVLEAGKDFARIYDTGKRHGSGVPVQQIKWSAIVLPILKQGEAA